MLHAALLAAALPGWSQPTPAAQELTLMSFNIRYDTAADGDHAWPHRRDHVLTTILDVNPSALAVQEALPHQVQAVKAANPAFKQVGDARDGGDHGEFSGLLINTEQLEVLESGHVWLSETPDAVASVGWDAALPRTASWALVRRWGSSDPAMLLVGTHFDHQGEHARAESARLIASQLPIWSDGAAVPVAVMGDLNAQPGSVCLKVFRDAGLEPSTDHATGTFQRFDPTRNGPHIDYILLNDKWHVHDASVMQPRKQGMPASDHDPVVASVTPRVPRGTIGLPRRSERTWTPPESTLVNLDIMPIPPDISDQARRTAAVLAARGDSETDMHQLSRVLAGFDHPFALPELGDETTRSLADIPANPARVQDIAADLLDTAPAAGPRLAVDRDFAEAVLALLAVPAGTFYIESDDFALLDVINRSQSVDFGAIVAGIRVPTATEPPTFGDGKPLAVTGTVLSAELGPSGWRVVGGSGPNTYDMTRIQEVFDTGGDDRYTASDLVLGDRLIIDLAGDDVYTGTSRQGPAAGLLGDWIIDDRGGDDRYGQVGGSFSTGAGAFGVGMIIDRAGNDVYMGTHWSIGAAVYGAGIILDLGAGDDRYLGDFLTDAVGGPRGLGLVLDEAGDDTHMADGPTPSVYDTPNVHASFSQGMGFGYRKYAAGGIGILCDLAGDDRYQAGEFSQGGGYYHALGVLRDVAGDDVYDGNRYAQGFGVHQAFGVLIDDAGNDAYSGMTAADQGAAWDIAAGALLERAGDDTYVADGLAQGSAAQQAIAYLIDLDGSDRWQARSPAQGASGTNTYHWDATQAFSFSLLLNLGEGDDVFSLPRPAGEVTVTGASPPPAGLGVGCVINRFAETPRIEHGN